MKVLNYLEEKRTQELIGLMEVEFVRFLQQMGPGEPDEVFLAAAACLHAQKEGHVCLDLENWREDHLFGDAASGVELSEELKKKWLKALRKSALVSEGTSLKPLVLEGQRLYLHRYWRYEEALATWLLEKARTTHALTDEQLEILRKLTTSTTDLFEMNWQETAVLMSFIKDLIVISGGPGTGKTYTVLNIIAAHLLSHKENTLKVALAAPTGKAARRLAESIASGKENLPEAYRESVDLPDTAVTVHKLLGADYRGSGVKYHEGNKLPYDLIVVDEASMLDITMWVRLINAIGEHTKLIVLGDKDQLASVEAGSILGDICQGDNSFSEEIGQKIAQVSGRQLPVSKSKADINDCVIFLTKSYRFGEDSGIHNFSKAVNAGDADKAIELLNDPAYTDLKWLEPTHAHIQQVIREYGSAHYAEYMQGTPEERLQASNKRKILCALRKGPLGVEQINAQAEYQIRKDIGVLSGDEWYEGRIVMATQNDAVLKIRNGEIGMCESRVDPRILFDNEHTLRLSAARLKAYEPAFSITIHKSQGSEFEEVAILLPNQVNTILSKEILYTSVTRARVNTLIIANEEILRAAIRRSISRNSGLRFKLWQTEI